MSLVLVVDDEDGNRLALERILVREGLDVRHAADGKEALARSRDEAPDLIITDLGVLEVGDNGLTLRELAPGITVETLKANTGCPIDTTQFESSAGR